MVELDSQGKWPRSKEEISHISEANRKIRLIEKIACRLHQKRFEYFIIIKIVTNKENTLYETQRYNRIGKWQPPQAPPPCPCYRTPGG